MKRPRKDDVVFRLLETRYKIPVGLLETMKEILPNKTAKDYLNKSLFIFGAPGTGKTIFSLCLLYYYLKSKAPTTANSISFISIPDLLISLKNYYKLLSAKPDFGIEIDPITNQLNTPEGILTNQCKYTRYLILDDLGVGRSTDWTNEILYSIINHRYVHRTKGHYTIINTNFSKKELSEKVDERIVSRIFEMAEVLNFKKQLRGNI